MAQTKEGPSQKKGVFLRGIFICWAASDIEGQPIRPSLDLLVGPSESKQA